MIKLLNYCFQQCWGVQYAPLAQHGVFIWLVDLLLVGGGCMTTNDVHRIICRRRKCTPYAAAAGFGILLFCNLFQKQLFMWGLCVMDIFCINFIDLYVL